MQQVVDDYNKLTQSSGPKSWNDTRQFFIKKNLKATDNFQALSKAGICSAHNTVTDEHIDQLQNHISSLIDRNATYDKALTELALVVNNFQTNQSSARTPAASEPQTEIQTILAAIANLRQPTCPVVTKPKTEMQQILALLTANAGNKNNGGGGGCRNNNGDNNNGGNNKSNNSNNTWSKG